MVIYTMVIYIYIMIIYIYIMIIYTINYVRIIGILVPKILK